MTWSTMIGLIILTLEKITLPIQQVYHLLIQNLDLHIIQLKIQLFSVI